MKPLVSILMNCYNGEAYLKKALDSIFAQTYEHWEIIFWDNASTDSTPEIVKSYNDERIKYYRAEVNEPLGKARNLAIKKCTGDFIAILDVDDYWVDTKLEKQVALFETNPKAVVCYTDAFYVYDEKETQQKVSDALTLHEGDVYGKMLDQNFVLCATIMLRSEPLKEELFFSETLKYSEEYDLLLRSAKKGVFILIQEPLTYYRVHENALTRDVDQIIKEEDEFLEKYKDDLKTHGIDVNDRLKKRYRALVADLIVHKNRKKAKELLPNLLKYPDLKNITLYIIVVLRLDFLLKK